MLSVEPIWQVGIMLFIFNLSLMNYSVNFEQSTKDWYCAAWLRQICFFTRFYLGRNNDNLPKGTTLALQNSFYNWKCGQLKRQLRGTFLSTIYRKTVEVHNIKMYRPFEGTLHQKRFIINSSHLLKLGALS